MTNREPREYGFPARLTASSSWPDGVPYEIRVSVEQHYKDTKKVLEGRGIKITDPIFKIQYAWYATEVLDDEPE